MIDLYSKYLSIAKKEDEEKTSYTEQVSKDANQASTFGGLTNLVQDKKEEAEIDLQKKLEKVNTPENPDSLTEQPEVTNSTQESTPFDKTKYSQEYNETLKKIDWYKNKLSQFEQWAEKKNGYSSSLADAHRHFTELHNNEVKKLNDLQQSAIAELQKQAEGQMSTKLPLEDSQRFGGKVSDFNIVERAASAIKSGGMDLQGGALGLLRGVYSVGISPVKFFSDLLAPGKYKPEESDIILKFLTKEIEKTNGFRDEAWENALSDGKFSNWVMQGIRAATPIIALWGMGSAVGAAKTGVGAIPKTVETLGSQMAKMTPFMGYATGGSINEISARLDEEFPSIKAVAAGTMIGTFEGLSELPIFFGANSLMGKNSAKIAQSGFKKVLSTLGKTDALLFLKDAGLQVSQEILMDPTTNAVYKAFGIPNDTERIVDFVQIGETALNATSMVAVMGVVGGGMTTGVKTANKVDQVLQNYKANKDAKKAWNELLDMEMDFGETGGLLEQDLPTNKEENRPEFSMESNTPEMPELKQKVKKPEMVIEEVKEVGTDGGIDDYLLQAIKGGSFSKKEWKDVVYKEDTANVNDLIKENFDYNLVDQKNRNIEVREFEGEEWRGVPVIGLKGDILDGTNRINQAKLNGETEIKVLRAIPQETSEMQDEIGKTWEGKAWRSETGFGFDRDSETETAQKKIDFEADELGNEHVREDAERIARANGIDLKSVRGKDIIWVTKEKKDADRYGESEEFDLPKDSIILADDPDGGYLVLKNSNKYIAKQETSMDWKEQKAGNFEGDQSEETSPQDFRDIVPESWNMIEADVGIGDKVELSDEEVERTPREVLVSMFNDYKEAWNRKVSEYVEMLKAQGKQGVERGGLIRADDPELGPGRGEVIGTIPTISNNPDWYRAWAKSSGRGPNKSELLEEAIDQLTYGREHEFPPDQEFLMLEADIKATEKLLETLNILPGELKANVKVGAKAKKKVTVPVFYNEKTGKVQKAKTDDEIAIAKKQKKEIVKFYNQYNDDIVKDREVREDVKDKKKYDKQRIEEQEKRQKTEDKLLDSFYREEQRYYEKSFEEDVKDYKEGVEKYDNQKPATNEQKTLAHNLARKHLLITEKNGKENKRRYKNLAKSMTGKSSMMDMNESEAEAFIASIESVYQKHPWEPPVIPIGTTAILKDFFDKLKFTKPDLRKYITPKEYLLRQIGASPLTDRIAEAKKMNEIEKRSLNRWIDSVIHEINKNVGIGERIKSKLYNKPTKRVKIFRNLLNTYEKAPGFLNENDKKIFNMIREFTDDMLRRVNEVRDGLGLDRIKNIKAYIPHFLDEMSREIVAQKYPFPEDVKYWLGENLPEKVYNPTAMERRVREGLEDFFSKDLGALLKTMVKYDLRDIYLSGPYAELKARLVVLGDKIDASVKKEIMDYVKYDVFDYPTEIDSLLNSFIERIMPIQFINKMLKPLGRMITNPIRSISSISRQYLIMGVIWGRPKLALRNLFQRMLFMNLYPAKYLVMAQFKTDKKLYEQFKETTFYKLSHQFEDIPDALTDTLLTKIKKKGMVLYQTSHAGKNYLSNVDTVGKAGMFYAKEMVKLSHDKDSRYYRYAVKMSEKLGVPLEELLWTEKDIVAEGVDAASLSQWLYFQSDMPQAFRGQGMRAFWALNSWWMNYFGKHMTEGWIRTFTGRTSKGKLLRPIDRLNYIKGQIIIWGICKALMEAFDLDYERFLFLLGPLPLYLSPVGQLIFGTFNYISGDDRAKAKALSQIKYSLGAFIPGSMAWRDLRAYLRGDKTLKGLLFYTKKEDASDKDDKESSLGGKVNELSGKNNKLADKLKELQGKAKSSSNLSDKLNKLKNKN
ncbi:MAG: hypothetical protein ACOWWR_18525 [Eubacteriales bacterium]